MNMLVNAQLCVVPRIIVMKDLPASRLAIVTAWDAGFQVAPAASPLSDVLPGGEYVVECTASQTIALATVTVGGFVLDRLYVGTRFAGVTPDEGLVATGTIEDRQYRVEPTTPVLVGEKIRAVLRNISDAPQKPRVAMIVREGQEIPAAAAGWRVEGVRVGSEKRPLSPSCPTCDAPDRETLRKIGDAWCHDAWHGLPLPTSRPERSPVHAPKISRTLHDGPGNATLVRGCSCGAELADARAYAAHVDLPPRAVESMLGLVGVIYDLCDYPGQVTREEAAIRVARCLEFSP